MLANDDQFRAYACMNSSYYSQRTPTTAGILGNTIEEKTRAILGWTESVDHKNSDSIGPMKKKSSSRSATYPYDLMNTKSEIHGRKSSTSSANELSTLLLSNELTPPPSPILKNHLNGVTVVTLPRPNLIHHHPTRNASNQFHPYQQHQLPISPVSPPSNCAIPNPIVDQQQIDDSTNFRPTISATEIFQQLRTQVPHLSSEQSKFRILVQTVANVIELETKLAQLHEETKSLSQILEERKRLQHTHRAGGEEKPQNWIDHQQMTEFNNCTAFNASTPSASQDVPDDLQEIDVTAFRCLVSQNKSITDQQIDRSVDRTNNYWQPYYDHGSNASQFNQFSQQQSIGTLSNPLIVDTMS